MRKITLQEIEMRPFSPSLSEKTRQARTRMAGCGQLMQVIKLSRYGVLSALVFALAIAGHGENVTNSFGFTGPEFFPIDDQISLLHAADLDGDGLNDLIVANN